jgi:dolichol-phosphate mannosyltransferase
MVAAPEEDRTPRSVKRSPVVVVPTYNERSNLAPLIEQLVRHRDLRILIVDDDSPDGTGDEADRIAAARPGVSVLHRRGRRGLGRSYVDGFCAALDAGATHVLQMDADLSHDPADVPRLLDASRTADLVVASRYVAGGALRNWPLHRRGLSLFANWYVRAITRLPIRDCTSGFRCWRRDLLQRIPLDRIVSDGYAFQVELTWEAHRAGGRMTEIPIVFVERRLGASKMSGRVIVESAILPWRLVARPRR